MSCQRVRELLAPYVDGELEGEDLAMVSRHLEACPDCGQRLIVHRKLIAGQSGAAAPAPAAALSERLRQRVMAQTEGRPARRLLWRRAERVGNAMGWLAVSVVAGALVLALAVTGRPLVQQRLGLATATPTPSATGVGEATPTPKAPPAGQTPAPPTPATPASTPALSLVRYSSPALGFAVDYPAGWAVTTGRSDEGIRGRPCDWAAFTSDHYAGDSQAFGRYTMGVSVLQGTGKPVREVVDDYLRPISESVRQGIKERPLTVAGEPAIELTGLPGPRFGLHEVWIVHGGLEYRLSFAPTREDLLSHDPEAREAFDAFLRTFAFVPVTQTRVPPAATITPAPTPTQAPPEQVHPVVTSLVVTPEQPPVLYAVIDSRLYRSADRGSSWVEESYGGLPGGARLNGVTIDYRNPETMYALTSQGIYRRQGKVTWEMVHPLQANALAVDLQDSNVLWAGVHRTTETDAVILKSADGGRTWGKADLGIELWRAWTTDILVDPNNPNILWAVVRADGQRGWPPGHLYRGGRDGRWERLSLGQFEPAFDNVDSCHVAGIAYDPNANLLFAGCDLSYFNQGSALLLRSPNANAADSGAVRWEAATRFPPESPSVFGMARPLAVDAREPKSLFLSLSLEEWAQPRRYRILLSHDEGRNWQTLPLRGLP